jgi:hypothetical protein
MGTCGGDVVAAAGIVKLDAPTPVGGSVEGVDTGATAAAAAAAVAPPTTELL